MSIPGDAVYRGIIAVQNGKVSGSSDHSNFPVLLTDDNFWSELMDAGSESATNGGGGLRFSTDAAGSNQVAHQVVSFVTSSTPSSQKAQVWVKIPTLAYNTDTDIHVWSSPTASEEAATSTYGSDAVWADFKAVWNLEEAANTAAGGYKDSTGNGWHGTGVGSIAQSQPGNMGNAAQGDGLSTDLVTALYPDDTTGKRLTAWLKADANQNKYVGSLSPTRYGIGFQGNKFYVGCNGNFIISGTHTVGNQYKLTAVFDNGTCSLYVNGAFILSQSYSSPFTATTYFDLLSTSGSYPIDGSNAFTAIDGVLRNSDWELTEYNNQSDPGTFAIAGTFETGGGTTHETTANNSSISLASSAADLVQLHIATALNSLIDIGSSLANAVQAHGLSGSDSESATGSTAAALSQVHSLAASASSVLPETTVAAAQQIHALSGTSSSVAVQSTLGNLASGLVLTALQSEIAALSLPGDVTQAHGTGGSDSVINAESIAAAAQQEHQLTGFDSLAQLQSTLGDVGLGELLTALQSVIQSQSSFGNAGQAHGLAGSASLVNAESLAAALQQIHGLGGSGSLVQPLSTVADVGTSLVLTAINSAISVESTAANADQVYVLTALQSVIESESTLGDWLSTVVPDFHNIVLTSKTPVIALRAIKSKLIH